MKPILILVAIVAALGGVVWSIRSCSRQVSGVQGLSPGVEYVFRCRADQHEFKLTPKEMNAAFAAGEVRGSGDGIDLFKCQQCGKLEAVQTLKGEVSP